MTLFIALMVIGRFFGFQKMFGFPIKDLTRSDVTDQVKIVTKSEPQRYSKLYLKKIIVKNYFTITSPNIVGWRVQ